MKKNKKAIILIMASKQTDYQNLENSIKNTWYKIKNEEVEIIFYKENDFKSKECSYDGTNLFVPCFDGFYHLGLKTLLSFEWVLQNYNFEFIFRTNLGSFVDSQNIIKFLENKPKTDFYCGIVGKDTFYLGREVEFASGSGYFLSKDLVEKVVQNKDKWNHNIVDDVALGDLLSNLGIKVNRSAIRKNICDGETFYQLGEQTVESIDDSLVYHTRLRSVDRNVDVKNMNQIFENTEKYIETINKTLV